MMSEAENLPELGHYGQWLLAWIKAADRPVPSRLSLQQMDQDLTNLVAARVETFEAGQNDNHELPVEGTTEAMAIAAELQPVLNKLSELMVLDRQLSSGEQGLIGSQSWGDRPSISALRELGQDLTELHAANLSPWHEVGFTPTAYLPSELRVIAQAADWTVERVYQL